MNGAQTYVQPGSDQFLEDESGGNVSSSSGFNNQNGRVLHGGSEVICAVRRAASRGTMLIKGSKVLVAFSGGADSTALLFGLYTVADELGICLGAFHLNHRIRGDEALRDELHCKDFCEKLKIPIVTENYDVPAYANGCGMSLEEAARKIRYDRLIACCKGGGYDCIATAHHADDNLETVIFRMARGTGLRGLCGIPAVRYEKGIKIVRPLLECSRDDIESFIINQGLSYVTDSTNSDGEYSRNRIRQFIIPELKKINPSVTSAVSRMTSQLVCDDQALETISADVVHFPDEKSLPESLLRRRLISGYYSFIRENGLGGMLETVHIEALSKLSRSGVLWSRISLPGGISAVKGRDGIHFEMDLMHTDRIRTIPSKRKIFLSAGFNPIPDSDGNPFGCGAVYLKPTDDENCGNDCQNLSLKIKNEIINIYKLSIHISVNSDKLKDKVFVRQRADGDRIVCRGMTRRVKKLYQQKKISPSERDAIPVICDSDGILWIPGIAVRDGIKAVSSEENITELFYLTGSECESLFGDTCI